MTRSLRAGVLSAGRVTVAHVQVLRLGLTTWIQSSGATGTAAALSASSPRLRVNIDSDRADKRKACPLSSLAGLVGSCWPEPAHKYDYSQKCPKNIMILPSCCLPTGKRGNQDEASEGPQAKDLQQPLPRAGELQGQPVRARDSDGRILWSESGARVRNVAKQPAAVTWKSAAVTWQSCSPQAGLRQIGTY